jgi:hypothetical protein
MNLLLCLDSSQGREDAVSGLVIADIVEAWGFVCNIGDKLCKECYFGQLVEGNKL